MTTPDDSRAAMDALRKRYSPTPAAKATSAAPVKKAAKPLELTAVYDRSGALHGVIPTSELVKLKNVLYDESGAPVTGVDPDGKTVQIVDVPVASVKKAMKSMLRQEVFSRHVKAVKDQRLAQRRGR